MNQHVSIKNISFHNNQLIINKPNLLYISYFTPKGKISKSRFFYFNDEFQTYKDMLFCLNNIYNNSYETFFPKIPFPIIDGMKKVQHNYNKFIFYLKVIDTIELNSFKQSQEINYNGTFNFSNINNENFIILNNYFRFICGISYTDLYNRYDENLFNEYLNLTDVNNLTYITPIHDTILTHLSNTYTVFDIKHIISLYKLSLFLYHYSKYECFYQIL